MTNNFNNFDFMKPKISLPENKDSDSAIYEYSKSYRALEAVLLNSCSYPPGPTGSRNSQHD